MPWFKALSDIFRHGQESILDDHTVQQLYDLYDSAEMGKALAYKIRLLSKIDAEKLEQVDEGEIHASEYTGVTSKALLCEAPYIEAENFAKKYSL